MTFTIRLAHAEQILDDTLRASTALVEALESADAVADRLHAAWAGEVADAHLLADEAWRDDARRMVDALDEMRRVLRNAQGNYSAAAVANTAMWAGGC